MKKLRAINPSSKERKKKGKIINDMKFIKFSDRLIENGKINTLQRKNEQFSAIS